MEQRFYYKDKNGNKYSFKSEQLITVEDGEETIKIEGTDEEYTQTKYKQIPNPDLISITEEEFNAQPEIPEEVKAKQEIYSKIVELKQKLASTDYKAIKYAEGELTEEEYAETKAQRKEWREEINELESK